MKDDVVLIGFSDRRVYAPWGLFGGADGTTNAWTVIRDGEEIVLPNVVVYPFKRGDVLRVRAGAAGSDADFAQTRFPVLGGIPLRAGKSATPGGGRRGWRGREQRVEFAVIEPHPPAARAQIDLHAFAVGRRQQGVGAGRALHRIVPREVHSSGLPKPIRLSRLVNRLKIETYRPTVAIT